MVHQQPFRLHRALIIHHHSDATAADAQKTAEAVEAATCRGGGEVERLFAAAEDHFGGIDVAVNTAAMVLRKPIMETAEATGDLPRHRRLVDHRPDHLRQRWLHHPLSPARPSGPDSEGRGQDDLWLLRTRGGAPGPACTGCGPAGPYAASMLRLHLTAPPQAAGGCSSGEGAVRRSGHRGRRS